MSTRFVQIGDLHLGRQVHGVRMTEDQRHALAQVLSVIEREAPDALLVTGDVYDRAVPPAEAVSLLDDFLLEVARELETPVVMIPETTTAPSAWPSVRASSRASMSPGPSTAKSTRSRSATPSSTPSPIWTRRERARSWACPAWGRTRK